MKKTVFYHADCPDGFGAAWAVWKSWGQEASYHPHHHDDPLDPTRFKGEVVVFVDMAPAPLELTDLTRHASQVVVLDHHLSSLTRYEEDGDLAARMSRNGHRVHFDLEHSGAVLAWQHFHTGEPTPPLLLYVEDRDLWNQSLPHSDEVNAAINSYPRTFEDWERLASTSVTRLVVEGTPILRSDKVEVERSLLFAHAARLGEHAIEAVNARHQRSAIGHELARRRKFGRPWGLVYRLTGDRVDVSIYSIEDLDVARVATRYGGGGHKNAAGFSLSLRDWLEKVIAQSEGPEPSQSSTSR